MRGILPGIAPTTKRLGVRGEGRGEGLAPEAAGARPGATRREQRAGLALRADGYSARGFIWIVTCGGGPSAVTVTLAVPTKSGSRMPVRIVPVSFAGRYASATRV